MSYARNTSAVMTSTTTFHPVHAITMEQIKQAARQIASLEDGLLRILSGEISGFEIRFTHTCADVPQGSYTTSLQMRRHYRNQRVCFNFTANCGGDAYYVHTTYHFDNSRFARFIEMKDRHLERFNDPVTSIEYIVY